MFEIWTTNCYSSTQSSTKYTRYKKKCGLFADFSSEIVISTYDVIVIIFSESDPCPNKDSLTRILGGQGQGHFRAKISKRPKPFGPESSTNVKYIVIRYININCIYSWNSSSTNEVSSSQVNFFKMLDEKIENVSIKYSLMHTMKKITLLHFFLMLNIKCTSSLDSYQFFSNCCTLFPWSKGLLNTQKLWSKDFFLQHTFN